MAVSGGRHAHQLEQQHAAAVQERDRPREHTNRPLHRQDGEEGRGGGVLQGQRLRHELADDDREGGEEKQDDDGGGGFGRCGLHRAEPLEQGREPGRERGLPVRAQDQARQGDADLRRRDVPIELLGILEHRQHPGREDVAIFSHPPQPAPPRTHRGEFGGHIKPRQQDECDDDDPRQEHSRGSYCKRRLSRCARPGNDIPTERPPEGRRSICRAGLQNREKTNLVAPAFRRKSASAASFRLKAEATRIVLETPKGIIHKVFRPADD